MKTLTFEKQVNVDDLTKELVSAGFQVIGVSCSQNKTVIHLDDAELKDPTSTVESHIFVIPKTVEELKQEEKDAYASLSTNTAKINFMAKKLGLKD